MNQYRIHEHVKRVKPGERGFGKYEFKVLGRSKEHAIHHCDSEVAAREYAARCIPDWERRDLVDKIKRAQEMCMKIVVVEGEDRGVILKSNEAPTHYDEERKCHVYENDCFSELGQAMCELYDLLKS